MTDILSSRTHLTLLCASLILILSKKKKNNHTQVCMYQTSITVNKSKIFLPLQKCNVVSWASKYICMSFFYHPSPPLFTIYSYKFIRYIAHQFSVTLLPSSMSYEQVRDYVIKIKIIIIHNGEHKITDFLSKSYLSKIFVYIGFIQNLRFF